MFHFFLTKSTSLRLCRTVDDSKRAAVSSNNETVVDLNFRETGQSKEGPEKPLIYLKRVERRIDRWIRRGGRLLTREEGGAGGLRRGARVPFPAKSLSQSWPRIIMGQVILKLDDWPVTSFTKTKGQNLPYANVSAEGSSLPGYRLIYRSIGKRKVRSPSFPIVIRISRKVPKISSRCCSLREHLGLYSLFAFNAEYG